MRATLPDRAFSAAQAANFAQSDSVGKT